MVSGSTSLDRGSIIILPARSCGGTETILSDQLMPSGTWGSLLTPVPQQMSWRLIRPHGTKYTVLLYAGTPIVHAVAVWVFHFPMCLSYLFGMLHTVNKGVYSLSGVYSLQLWGLLNTPTFWSPHQYSVTEKLYGLADVVEVKCCALICEWMTLPGGVHGILCLPCMNLDVKP
jgi:hypothetical protein